MHTFVSTCFQNPSHDIPLGTFVAILSTTLIYLAIVWTSGASMLRDAIGLPVALGNATLANATIPSPSNLDVISDCGNSTCPFGMLHDNGVSELSPLP